MAWHDAAMQQCEMVAGGLIGIGLYAMFSINQTLGLALTIGNPALYHVHSD